MKPTLSSQDEEIIELLKRLGTLKAEYPADLLAARRAAFAVQIEEQKVKGGAREENISQERVIELLEGLGSIAKVEYPAELLLSRRASFIDQIKQYTNGQVGEEDTAQDQVTELLGSLKSAPVEYPPALLSPRRESFLAQIRQHNHLHAPEEAPSEEQIIELLGNLKSAPVEYPPELLSARRAAFLAQIEQYNNGHIREESSSEEQVIQLLGNLGSARVEYPDELLSARRAAFLAQIRQHNNGVEAQKELVSSPNGSILKLFDRLKSFEIEYPLKLWSVRRSAFAAQVRENKISVLDALRSAIRTLFSQDKKHPSAPGFSIRRTSMVLATLLMVAFVSSLAYGNRPLSGIFGSVPSQQEGSSSSPVAVFTSTGAVAQIICKPGLQPPLCLAQEADQSHDLTFPGNGSARPAVAKDTVPSFGRVHQAAYANDGVYGPGASWVSNSAFSWIKIDLGDVQTINTITFGRDRLGNLNDGDPGQFFIAVALSDDIYAGGNSHNDSIEYTEVYGSEKAGFDGIISGPETIEARFEPVQARFVKITFENAGTAVDEIEAFMIQPFGFVSNPTQRPRDTLVPASFTPIPTNTLIPSKTATLIPTKTPTLIPTNTLVPTFTLFPTDTATPRPTNTPRPTHTPRPTNTDVPTDTPEPPTDTPEPPTDTPEPPTDTPEPPPTDTPEPPPTATSEPLLFPSSTPEVTLP